MKRIIALLGIMFALLSVAVVATPATSANAAQSAVVSQTQLQQEVTAAQQRKSVEDCQPSGHTMCYFTGWVASQGGPVGLSDNWPDYVQRNTCIVLQDYNDNAYYNSTTVYWFAFHTTTCGGSHIAHAPGAAGQLPAGWNGGAIHAVMRTSTT